MVSIYCFLLGADDGTRLASQYALLSRRRVRTFWLKTVHRTVFFTPKARFGFKSHHLSLFFPLIKQERSTFVLLFALVRMMGLEPIRSDSHAPQTCASTSSATSAFRVAVPYGTLILYYNSFVLSSHFCKIVAIFVISQKHICR